MPDKSWDKHRIPETFVSNGLHLGLERGINRCSWKEFSRRTSWWSNLQCSDQSFYEHGRHKSRLGNPRPSSRISTRRPRKQNNFALLSLLSGINQARAFAYARENFAKDNENPYFTTTWAFALEIQGRSQEALNLLEFLTEEERNDPQRAVYIAKIYHEAGDNDMANQLLNRVDESTLFAEEKFLQRSIRRSIQEVAE